jgi:hypothetical protein
MLLIVAAVGTFRSGCFSTSDAYSFFGPHVGYFRRSATTTFSTSGGVLLGFECGIVERSYSPRGPPP